MKRRIIGVLAAVALALSTFGIAAPAAAQGGTGTYYVALGDSVAAGTGNLPYVDVSCPHTDGTTKPALRSKWSYPFLLAARFWVPVVSEACSEHDTQEVALYQLGNLGTATKYVTLTVGVNDVNFDADPAPDWADTLGACTANAANPGLCTTLIGLSLQSVATVNQKIAGLIGSIRAKAPNAKIFVTGYAPLFGDFPATCSVGGGVSFGAAQAQELNVAVGNLNGLIAAGVAASGDAKAAYVDVVPGFDGHGLCDTGIRWIGGVQPPGAPTKDVAFHPNGLGQAAYAHILKQAITG